MTETLNPFPSPIRAPLPPFGFGEASEPKPRPRSRPLRVPESPLVAKARKALSSSISPSPTRAQDGVGGTYFLYDDSKTPFAVFKPVDEEPGANRDSKRLVKPLLPPGGGAVREVAAYSMDQRLPPHLRAGVPETQFLAHVVHAAFAGGVHTTKAGSLQRFIVNDGEVDSISPSRIFAADVEKVAVLDLRLLNLDRNAENLLVIKVGDAPTPPPSPVVSSFLNGRRGSTTTPCYGLVPIDHAYTLPPTLHGAFFEWQHWPQAKVPLSDEMAAAISNLDLDAEAELLQSLGLDEAAIRTATIAALWLQVGAAEGLNLHQLASVVAAPMPTQRSALEELLVGVYGDVSGPLDRIRLKTVFKEAARLVKADAEKLL